MQRSFASSSGLLLRSSSRNASSAFNAGLRRMSVSVKAAEESNTEEVVPAVKSTSETGRPARPAQAVIRRKPAEQRKRELLYPVLAEQRRESTDAQASAGDEQPMKIKPTKQNRGRDGRPAIRPQKRVDLYLNETGYPQSRISIPGHEQEDLHTKRREHLAPHPPDAVNDALSGFVDAVAEHSKVSRPPRRRPEGANRRPQGAQGSYSQPRSTGGDRPSPTNQQDRTNQPRIPGLRDRQSRFKAQGAGPGGNRSGPPGGARRPGPRPGAGRPRRSPSRTPLVPAKVFGPAPETVLVGKSQYTFAATLPKKGAVPRVQMSIHRAQWSAQRKDIEKAHVGTGNAAAVLKGDWQSYIAPVFKQVQEASKKKSSHGTPGNVRRDILDRAGWAVAMNPSMRLQGKLTVTEKVAATL